MNIDDLLGDYGHFFAQQKNRLTDLGISIEGYSISHLAYRTQSYDEYLAVRDALEALCRANVENVWNGRPISKMLLAEPLTLGDGATTELLELLPPPHRSTYQMGFEHLGVVVGETVDDFALQHRKVLTGQQYQNEVCEPYFVTFEDHTSVKFYHYSLHDVIVKDGHRFDGFHHASDWKNN
jgi:predicted metalloenzyme YecM